MAQDTAEEEITKVKEEIERFGEDKKENEQLITKEQDEARHALEEEQRTEEERKRREDESRRKDEVEEKLKHISKMEEELRNEKKEKMALKEELRLAKEALEDEQKKTEEERRRREEEVEEKEKEIWGKEMELINKKKEKMTLEEELRLARNALEEEKKKTEEERRRSREEEIEEKVKEVSEKMSLEEALRLARDALEDEQKKTQEERRRREAEVEEKVKEMSMTLKEELRLARDELEEEKKKTAEERGRREEVEEKLKEISEKKNEPSNEREEKDDARNASEEENRRDRMEEERRSKEEVGEKQTAIQEMEKKPAAEEVHKMMLEERIEEERKGKEEERKGREEERRKREATEEMLHDILKREEKKDRRREKQEENEKKRAADERKRNEELCDGMKKQEEKMKAIKDTNLQLQEFQKLCVDILRGEGVHPASLVAFMEMAGGDNHQLHVAVSLGVPWLVEHVKSTKSHLLKARNGRGWTPLCLATARGNVTIIDTVCEPEEDLEAHSPPLLHVAAANRRHRAAEFLYNYMEDHTATFKGFTAYQVATIVGDEKLAMRIKPITSYVLNYFADRRSWDLPREDIEELMLYPTSPNSGNTLSGINTSLVPSTKSPDGVWLPKGLSNLGNTCYMNSVMQCLYHTTPLAAELRKLEGDTRQGEVVKATVKVMAALHRREHPRRDIMVQLKRVAGRKDEVYNSSGEQEAHDFLCQMLEWLHEEMAPPQEEEEEEEEVESVISDLFHGTQQSIITCVEKKRPQVLCNNGETFSNLSLTITEPTNLEDAVEQYFRDQELVWECDRCGREHMCQHAVSLTKSPPVLVLHLNRSNRHTHSRHKAKVSYSEVLDVPVDNGQSHRYSLFAVCCHDGSMASGHYTAYCRSGDQWYRFSDTSVTRIAGRDVVDIPSAHILFYTNDMNSWVIV